MPRCLNCSVATIRMRRYNVTTLTPQLQNTLAEWLSIQEVGTHIVIIFIFYQQVHIITINYFTEYNISCFSFPQIGWFAMHVMYCYSSITARKKAHMAEHWATRWCVLVVDALLWVGVTQCDTTHLKNSVHLGWARHQANITAPASFLDNILLTFEDE